MSSVLDLALDPATHDWPTPSEDNNFDLPLVSGIDQISQNLNIRLRFFLGEWYLDTTVGVPYYQFFFVKNPNRIQVETFLKDEIIRTPGVIELTSFSSDFKGTTRDFSVKFSAQTESGETAIEATLP